VSPTSPAKGVACPAAELMRRDEWFTGQPLCVRVVFMPWERVLSLSQEGA
jgi:hypothetical protein